MGTVSVTHLSKSYQGKKAVSDLTFQIQAGRITGLLGPNGAGKTTVLRLLTGFLSPNSGKILFSDSDFSQNRFRIQKKIGYLPESAPVYTTMTAREYLFFCAKARGVSPSRVETSIRSISYRFDLETVLECPISFLSKGYKQRLCLAGTLLHDPEYVFLDEPTSGLDPIQISEFKDTIRSLAKTKTILLSSHILGEVQELCDHILVIADGTLIADSPVNELSSVSKRVLLWVEADPEDLRSFFRNTLYKIETTGKREDSFSEYKMVPRSASAPDPFEILKMIPFRVRAFYPEKNSLESIFETLKRSESE
ncbi:ABC transporter ATP-binding protein [Leptospira gomenensis]|uniref:ABC transporter ATP-binding protein n=1 Tax=Leptospira gomenensis TaxID=2484974 RepID=A0A5F1YT23_9LEPT|nr:ABC transporter ATP-binding protein [Leptospira gomenensis]TGK38600.1 ABC transporter ATP-binding protein [Leptospira gomenensis]TGK42837.1 ABC transporter ATP-binding protein [Leptospira gomenensis]TGK49618.1 ABC transporter ATP-binding protein [Leptospira gomenensis]TGK60712.1 ABC transporter ATP-binding protein [Leptospira gomenensis]